MLGLDLYQQFNTVTDWSAVAGAGVKFVYIKLTDGGGQAIVHADNYVNGARSVGIKVGGYHYMEATPSPEQQADMFAAELRRLNALDIAPMLDIEENSIPVASRVDFGQRFLRRLQANLGGARVGIYSSSSWFRTLTPDTWGIPDLVDWDAEYGPNDGTEHPISSYSGHVDIHQYTSVGHIAGISGDVDMDDAYTTAISAHTATSPNAEDDDVIIKCQYQNKDGSSVELTGIYSGGFLSGVSPATAASIDTDIKNGNVFPRWVDSAEWDDLDNKGNQVLQLLKQLITTVGQVPAVTVDPTVVGEALAAAEGPQIVSAFTQALSSLPTELAGQILEQVKAALDKAVA